MWEADVATGVIVMLVAPRVVLVVEGDLAEGVVVEKEVEVEEG